MFCIPPSCVVDHTFFYADLGLIPTVSKETIIPGKISTIIKSLFEAKLHLKPKITFVQQQQKRERVREKDREREREGKGRLDMPFIRKWSICNKC